MSSEPKAAAGDGGRRNALGQRMLIEMKKYAIITIYLWVLFALFAAYKRELLQENGVSVWSQSYAIVNAMIFAKVVLLGQVLSLGDNFRKQALIWVVLGKSVLFTALLMAFHAAEEAVRAWFEHLAVAEAVLSMGGGSVLGLLIYAALLFVALVPLFAFEEVSNILGKDQLWRLLFARDRRA